MSHHIIDIVGLTYVYPDGTAALQDISFRVAHGESVAIVGANGAGKSTLLLHLNGCLKPSGGTIRIGDLAVTRTTLPAVRQTVGMVFQDPNDQLFMPTVYDDVAFGPLNMGLGPEEVDVLVEKALCTVGARHLKNRPPYKLSGGEKRSVAIATVLSMSPAILVMDEPTSNLDPKARHQLIDLLKSFDHTKIIATHDLDMVLDLCERTIVIHDGRITADGATADVFHDDGLLAGSHLEKPLRMQGCPVCTPR